jgi:hypothetical protein
MDADNGKSRMISFRCPLDVATALEAEASRKFCSVSAIARQAAFKLVRDLLPEEKFKETA